MTRALLFGAATVASSLLIALAFTRAYPAPAEQQAIWMSAGIAIAVQLSGFAFAKLFAAWNPIAGWGAAVLLRFIAVVLHALFGVKLMGMPATPSLLSLVACLFVTTLFEPLFLAPPGAFQKPTPKP